ncbi:MAG: hypothetical protein H6R08_2389 [Proteobacteria bacterium]|nr:hypothetical protein [Pseudomonadota bacterium]
MASSGRSDKALHPTNLHVNEALFPRDTIQSRLPDPEWLEHWLDEQIHFDETSCATSIAIASRCLPPPEQPQNRSSIRK